MVELKKQPFYFYFSNLFMHNYVNHIFFSIPVDSEFSCLPKIWRVHIFYFSRAEEIFTLTFASTWKKKKKKTCTFHIFRKQRMRISLVTLYKSSCNRETNLILLFNHEIPSSKFDTKITALKELQWIVFDRVTEYLEFNKFTGWGFSSIQTDIFWVNNERALDF